MTRSQEESQSDFVLGRLEQPLQGLGGRRLLCARVSAGAVLATLAVWRTHLGV